MSQLDINTERGQETLLEEKEAAKIIESYWPGCRYIHTDKTGTAAVDAMIFRHDKYVAVAETKCRQMTLDRLTGEFNNEWLVTNDKLKNGAMAADLFDVEFWGVLYLVPSKVLIRVKLYRKGQWLVPIRTAHTETQKTVNGGKIVRENAYIDVSRADILPGLGTDAERAGHPNGFVGYDAEDRFVHYCQCGREAGLGFGVRLAKGQLGTWYCAEHKPAA